MIRLRSLAYALVGSAVVLAAVFPCPLAAEAAAPAAPAPPLLDARQLKPGDKGYGLTVFSGTEPERFDVEVIGLLTNFLPRQDLILVKTTHPRLEAAKIVAGMSGSPVYVNGKMIGAYAYGWSFSAEPIAGVTPIASMLDELRRPLPPEMFRPLPGAGSPKPSARNAQGDTANTATAGNTWSGRRFLGNPTEYTIEEHGRQVAVALGSASSNDGLSPAPISTPLMVGGMSDSSLAFLRQHLSTLGFEALQAGGGGQAQTDTSSRYVDGGAIGVQLVSGDMSATGLGTVTRVEGNRLLAFGHPMSSAGVSRLPTAVARVHWIFASQQRSRKMGEAVRPLGALVNDRQAAIVVDSSVQAPTVPLDVDIRGVEGVPHPRWSVRMAHERSMVPMYFASVVGNAIEVTTSEDSRDVTWNAHTTVRLRGRGEITLHDYGVAVGGTPGADTFARSRAARAMGALLNNPWEPVDIESVRTQVDIRFARDLFELRGAVPLETEVDAGRKARIRVQLMSYSGKPEYRTVEVDIPRELAGTTVEIELNPGHQEAPPVAIPESVSDLLSVLPRQAYPPDTLVGSVRVGGHGVAFRGQVATRLPPGALDTLRSTSSSMAPEPVPSYARTIIPLGKFVVGSTSVRIRVRDVLR